MSFEWKLRSSNTKLKNNNKVTPNWDNSQNSSRPYQSQVYPMSNIEISLEKVLKKINFLLELKGLNI